MDQEDPKYKCCEVKNMCGQTLAQSAVAIGIFTMVVSVSSAILALITISLAYCSETPVTADPVNAINLLVALVTVALSPYQLIISLLVLWAASQSKPRIYLLSLWFVSHLSIVAVFGMLFVARAAVCFTAQQYFPAAVTVLVAISYVGLFVYFILVMNSYIHSLDGVRYF